MGLKLGSDKVEKIISGEWGEWRQDDADDKPDDIAQEAAMMILGGATPTAVAERFPRFFIKSGYGVCRLWESLHRARWLR